MGSAAGPEAGLARALRRLDERIRRWSPHRWAQPAADGRPRAQAAHELAVTLAELARRAGNGAPQAPPPTLEPHGIADQLTVLGGELLGAPQAATHAQAGMAAVERLLDVL